GNSWAPFDQLDWVVGALIALALFVPVSPLMAAYALLIGVPLHFFVRWIGSLIALAFAGILGRGAAGYSK
ncbi:MAG: hypothetical protein AAB923_02455, partial [Patescibacteria group bacterium]